MCQTGSRLTRTGTTSHPTLSPVTVGPGVFPSLGPLISIKPFSVPFFITLIRLWSPLAPNSRRRKAYLAPRLPHHRHHHRMAFKIYWTLLTKTSKRESLWRVVFCDWQSHSGFTFGFTISYVPMATHRLSWTATSVVSTFVRETKTAPMPLFKRRFGPGLTRKSIIGLRVRFKSFSRKRRS